MKNPLKRVGRALFSGEMGGRRQRCQRASARLSVSGVEFIRRFWSESVSRLTEWQFLAQPGIIHVKYPIEQLWDEARLSQEG